ncbi:hypothetical protein GCM10022267_83660 [Lentzea roselyniae]|uniref:Uncharacterized protein n=1 Tax=Lentzea roselyniae TaxID=531940 RepID=A0ABP7C952_9PSEU
MRGRVLLAVLATALIHVPAASAADDDCGAEVVHFAGKYTGGDMDGLLEVELTVGTTGASTATVNTPDGALTGEGQASLPEPEISW